ncbi:MAG TPA: right-handed parallel beta-helix repeat-containing protein [Thermoanaerobaculia bacterium]|nr:right-handed parallel beta-helix repeat-containing protein [Thermoanaerobaculia bacterium]
MRTIRHLALTALFAFAGLAGATEYYVAKTGSDSNSGLTASTPFLTINKALSLWGNGDTIWVNSGTYNETITIWNKSNVQLIGTGPTRPIIDGTNKSPVNGLVVIGGDDPGTDGVLFQGFEVTNSNVSGILIWEASNVAIKYNKVHHNERGGIIAGAYAPGVNDYIHIFENIVTDNVRDNMDRDENAEWLQGIGLMYTNHGTIEGNYVSKNWGEGIDYISSDNGLIVRNDVWDNFSTNIYLDNAQHTRVDRNWVYFTGDTNFKRGGNPPGGITVANEDYDYDNPTDYLTIVNNIVQWTNAGFHYGRWDNNNGLHHTVVANNTFYNLAYVAIWIQQANHDTTEIRNNIIYQGGSTKGYLDLWNPTYTTWLTAGLTFSHNCWYNGNANTKVTGTGDYNGNPQLVNAGSGSKNDYKLATGSPLINIGTTISGVTNDFYTSSSVRPTGNAYDIGADEY